MPNSQALQYLVQLCGHADWNSQGTACSTAPKLQIRDINNCPVVYTPSHYRLHSLLPPVGALILETLVWIVLGKNDRYCRSDWKTCWIVKGCLCYCVSSATDCPGCTLPLALEQLE